jgi:sortase A
MKKFLFVILFLFVVGGGLFFGTTLGQKSAKPQEQAVLPAQEKADVKQPTPTAAINSIIPTRISIPKINVDTAVESVGMDDKGRMDVPKEADNTAWFKPGYKPGQVGQAVIDGHYDKASGDPAVFYNINKLTKGDEIIVTGENGKKLTFSVVKLAEYPDEDFPIKDVFGPSSKPMLNLITCQGKWNEESHNYSHRGVIYAELVK